MSFVKLGMVFVVIMVAVSAAFNFIFGWRIGENSHTITAYFHDGFVYGALSIASDGLKVVCGVLLLEFFLSKNMGVLLRGLGIALCGLLFSAAMLYSLNSAFGSISTNRTDMAGLRQAKATNYDTIKGQLDHAQKELSWVGQDYRSTDTVKADMAGMRQSFLWSRTSGCADATVTESRDFCQKYSGLAAEMGASARAEHLTAEIERYREELAAAGGHILADPHAKFLNELTGYPESTIVLAWLLLVVALVEGGSTLGPILIWLAKMAERKSVTLPESIIIDPVVLPESNESVPVLVEAPETSPEGPKTPTPPNGRFSGKSPALGSFAHRDLPANDDEDDEAYDTKVKVLRPELVDDLTQKWLDHRAAYTPINLGMQAKKIYSDYAEFCRKALDVEPVSREHFGRSLKRKGVKKHKISGILRYNLKIQPSEVGHSAVFPEKAVA